MDKAIWAGVLIAAAVSSSVAVRHLTGRGGAVTPIIISAVGASIAAAVITRGNV